MTGGPSLLAGVPRGDDVHPDRAIVSSALHPHFPYLRSRPVYHFLDLTVPVLSPYPTTPHSSTSSKGTLFLVPCRDPSEPPSHLRTAVTQRTFPLLRPPLSPRTTRRDSVCGQRGRGPSLSRDPGDHKTDPLVRSREGPGPRTVPLPSSPSVPTPSDLKLLRERVLLSEE